MMGSRGAATTVVATSQYAAGCQPGKKRGKQAMASSHVTATSVAGKQQCTLSSIRRPLLTGSQPRHSTPLVRMCVASATAGNMPVRRPLVHSRLNQFSTLQSQLQLSQFAEYDRRLWLMG